MNSGKYAFSCPGRLEHPVELALDVLPDRVAPRLDDHAAADGRVLGQVGGPDDLLVPLGIVVGPSGLNGGSFCLLVLTHVRVIARSRGFRQLQFHYYDPYSFDLSDRLQGVEADDFVNGEVC